MQIYYVVTPVDFKLGLEAIPRTRAHLTPRLRNDPLGLVVPICPSHLVVRCLGSEPSKSPAPERAAAAEQRLVRFKLGSRAREAHDGDFAPAETFVLIPAWRARCQVVLFGTLDEVNAGQLGSSVDDDAHHDNY